jgi:hypothetical protein
MSDESHRRLLGAKSCENTHPVPGFTRRPEKSIVRQRVCRDIPSSIDQMVDPWLAEYERANAVFELAIRLRQPRVLPQVFRP